MEGFEGLVQQSQQLTKSLRHDQEELAQSCVALAETAARLTVDLQAARTRVAQLEGENAHLRARIPISAEQLTGDQKEGLLAQLVTLRDILVEEQTEKEQLAQELLRLRTSHQELELQLSQLSPSKPAKKARLPRLPAEESRSYKSLYQKRRLQSEEYRFS